ncbi:MAG: class I SAM-dependent methyltransferase [Chitinophagaceae bacterium]|nr:class I SAM-dependent methyltransferase [Chitinophagaceae bacterium]
MFFRKWLSRFRSKPVTREPSEAYNQWANTYDQQPDNLMLQLDETVFSGLLNEISLTNLTVIDYGCGTGRHWPLLLTHQPGILKGFDVSEGMLAKLKDKIPGAPVFLLKEDTLDGVPDQSADWIISTLTMAHLKEPRKVFEEWNRVLKPGGGIIITDYHPAILAKGGQRTFRSGDELISIQNQVWELGLIRQMAGQLHWTEIRLVEKILDDSLKAFYEKQNALHVFEAYQGLPLIYGIRFKKEK